MATEFLYIFLYAIVSMMIIIGFFVLLYAYRTFTQVSILIKKTDALMAKIIALKYR